MAKQKRFGKSDYKKTASLIHEGIEFNGKISFTEPITISGNFKGTISSDSLLYVAPGAKIEGDISVHTAIIKGCVQGEIHASDTVELLESCEVNANIQTNKLKISDGVIFEGHCECASADAGAHV